MHTFVYGGDLQIFWNTLSMILRYETVVAVNCAVVLILLSLYAGGCNARQECTEPGQDSHASDACCASGLHEGMCLCCVVHLGHSPV